MTTALSASPGCCPITLGEVCWDSGAATGRAWAVYDPTDETTQFLDQITGDPVASNFIVSCADDAGPTDGVAVVGHLVANAAGNVAAGKQSVTFTNVGTAQATVLGANIAPGESITWSAYYDESARIQRRLPQIAYVGSATGLLSISWID